MWSFNFFPTRPLTLTQAINAKPEAVIAVLHDPQIFLRLGPYVGEVTPDTSDSSQFTITDFIPVIGSFRVKTTYKVSVEMHADGLTASSAAGVGTKTRSNFTVNAGKDDNTTEVTQNSMVTVSLFAPTYFDHHVVQETHLRTLGFFSIVSFYHGHHEDGSLLNNLASRF
jgi:carbon monoxide dehydrogenase subunit G